MENFIFAHFEILLQRFFALYFYFMFLIPEKSPNCFSGLSEILIEATKRFSINLLWKSFCQADTVVSARFNVGFMLNRIVLPIKTNSEIIRCRLLSHKSSKLQPLIVSLQVSWK